MQLFSSLVLATRPEVTSCSLVMLIVYLIHQQFLLMLFHRKYIYPRYV